MARVGRLSPTGVSGRFFGYIVAATGTLACGATVSGVGADAGTGGSITASTTWTGVGRSVSASTGSILARGIFDAGVGATVSRAAGSLAAVAQFTGSSGGHLSRLSPLGITGRYFEQPPRLAVTPRLFNVTETFGLSIAISDFTERVFYIADTFGLSLNTTVYLAGAGGNFNATTAWSGISGAIAAPTATIAATSTWSGVGQNVITNSGDGSLAITVDFAGQGSTAGTVFGVGVGSLVETTAFTGVGRANAAATGGAFAESSVFTGVAAPLFTAVGSLSAVSNWDNGNSTTFLPSTGAILSTVTIAGQTFAIGSSLGACVCTVSLVGHSILPPAAPARRNRHTVIQIPDRSVNVIKKTRRTAI